MIIIALQEFLSQYGLHSPLSTVVATGLGLLGVFLIAWLSVYVAQHYIVRLIRYLASHVHPQWSKRLIHRRMFHQLSYLAPLLIFYYTAPLMATESLPFSGSLAHVLRSCSILLMLLVVTIAMNNFLSAAGDIYHDFSISTHRPIKSYIQVIKILLFGVSAILIISTLLGQSPLTLLTGLGALTAILLLIFKDSILGFVASVQISSYDMVRIGDWIEIPKYGVDGDVLDISLNTIKIQNFDKTIITIPSHAILNEGVKNWRGMKESGGRRIKRAIYIDMHRITFCTKEMLQRFSKIQYVAAYIQDKTKEIDAYNAALDADFSVLANGRHLTNIGVFRAYVEAYLKHHPDIHQQLTFIIRQLHPTEKGLPIEIYIFTNDTNWTRYEAIQADIFDHILSVIPEFHLSTFQDISNAGTSHYARHTALQNHSVSDKKLPDPVAYNRNSDMTRVP